MPRKTIKRDLLLCVINAYKKYERSLSGDREREDNAWKEWKDACVKAFPTDKRCYREWQTLKNISRDIGYKDFETIVKVYQALGYEII